jgi:hypothetical protein
MAHSVLKVGDGDTRRRRDDSVGIFAAGAVEAKQGVEMDGPACLVLGDLAVGQAGRGQPFDGPGDAAVLSELDEVAFYVLLGAPPQFSGGGVPDDMRRVVVAVRAKRLPEAVIAEGVTAVAGQRLAVRAGAGVAPGVARFGLAAAAVFGRAGVGAYGPGVDRPEGRGGKGSEHDRVTGDSLRDALASGQACADQVE